MADIRKRGQAGTDGPGRHHADDRALDWSVTAMTCALRRVEEASAADLPQAIAAATEAMWWVTAVDAAMARHYPAAYGRALAALHPAARRAVEKTFAGLRFIRSQLGHSADPGDFIQHGPAPGAPGATWMWRPVPPPPPASGRARETSPYREYRTQLAGRPLAEALTRGAAFLSSTYAAASDTHRKGTAIMRNAPVPSGGAPLGRSPLRQARR
jgi:hypothetical protein